MVSDAHSEAAQLLKRHDDLEALHGDGDGGNFLSGWQCDNPWSRGLQDLVAAEGLSLDVSKYAYFGGDAKIREPLEAFHVRADGTAPEALLFGQGASPLIFTFCAWLKERGIDEIYYIPPLYFSMHFALRFLGVRARPISGRHAYEGGFSINLPTKTAVLLFADPIWYAGVLLGEEHVKRIAGWQADTGSFVCVDGSFQYMRWDQLLSEPTSHLDPSKTFRILCPTKALAMHGYRFAYAVVPRSLLQDYSRIYDNIYGSASVDSAAFARVAGRVLNEGQVVNALMQSAAERHSALRSNGSIRSEWEPTCGYFIFEEIARTLPESVVLMDGTYFEQKRYSNYRRINLLSPSIGLLR